MGLNRQLIAKLATVCEFNKQLIALARFSNIYFWRYIPFDARTQRELTEMWSINCHFSTEIFHLRFTHTVHKFMDKLRHIFQCEELVKAV